MQQNSGNPNADAPKILFAEDEPEILDLFTKLLTEHGYEVIRAKDGAEAKEKILAQPIDLIVIDMAMPRVSGLELAKWRHEQHLQVPLVIMSAFANDDHFEQAKQLGCKLLFKPVTATAFLDLVRIVVAANARYARVPVEDFLAGKKLEFPVYKRSPEGRFEKLAETGAAVDGAKLQAWKSAGIPELWLTAADYEKYLDTNLKLLHLVAESRQMAPDQRMRVLRHALSVVYESFRVKKVTKQTLAAADAAVELALESVATGPPLVHLLGDVTGPEQISFAHAALSGLLCVLMSKVMGWTSKRNILLLSVAGFIHDVGLLELPYDLQHKNPERMTPDELAIYRSHPKLGAQALTQAGAHEELVAAAMQHHENSQGTGFPARLSRTEIFPMSGIVCLVDTFLERVLLESPEARQRPELLLAKIVESGANDFDPPSLLALQLALTEPDLIKAHMTYAGQVGH